MKKGLVLGGGGLVGMAYHAGALKALDEWGIDPSGADIVVGTSAGSIIASYLASGWQPTDFYEYAHGRHRDVVKDPADTRDAVRQIFDPLWTSPAERVRRSVGSFFALASSRGLWRGGTKGRVPHAALRHSFPSGLYSTERTRLRLEEDLPARWPREGLYISAADLYSGRRVPFGRKGAPEATLPEAVLASTAIPGMFPPVRIGDRQYVDGGVVTATSLDLAADDGCTTILCIAPLGYRGEGSAIDPKLLPAMFMRQFFARSLRKEVNAARERGCEVFVIRPWLDELRHLGTNAMRYFDRKALTDASRAGVLRLLESNAGHPVLSAFQKTREQSVG